MVTKKAYLVFTGRGPDAELYSVRATMGAAQADTDIVRENGYYPHVSIREVDKRGLEDLVERDLTEVEFSEWGVA